MIIAQQPVIQVSNTYLDKNPTWHAEDSPWKASQLLKMVRRHNLAPNRLIEVGCGAGEILNQLHAQLPNHVQLLGYEISRDAIELCKTKTKERLHFVLGNFIRANDFADLILILDVVEHIENCFEFLRACAQKGHYKIYHFPLELTVSNIFRNNLITSMEKVRHLHFYCKDTVMSLLKDTGHEVIDFFYTYTGEIAKRWQTKLLNVPRKLLYLMHNDFAVRLLGGYSIMILTR